ncbi:hypothetical protein [Pokkaliibacter plantistimulans]
MKPVKPMTSVLCENMVMRIFLLTLFLLTPAFYAQANTELPDKSQKPIERVVLQSQTTDEVPSIDQAHSLIADYRADPVSDAGARALSKLITFAEKSDSVKVVLKMKDMPWREDDRVTVGINKFVLAAYIIGSIDSELKESSYEKARCSGMSEIISSLNKLKDRIDEVQYDIVLEDINKANNDGKCDFSGI